MSDNPITLPDMCQTHQALLVQQAGYGPKSPWRGLVISAQITLFQMVTCDKAVHERMGGDIQRLSELGCLACLKPDCFGEVVQAAKDPDKGALKRLGERYIADCQRR